MKSILLALNIVFFVPVYCQNIDYNKYESSKIEDLSYKVYLDNQNSNTSPPFLSNDDSENRLIISNPLEIKYSYADKGEGNYAYQKASGEWAFVSSANHLDFGKGHVTKKIKIGEWYYYFNGKLKEKSNYAVYPEGERQGPTYFYNDNGLVSDTLYYYNDYVDGVLNLDKMNHYIEYLRHEITYSKYSSKFLNGEWIETNSWDNHIHVGAKNRNNRRDGIWKVYIINGNEKKLEQIIRYDNGVRQGKSISYNFSGNIDGIENFDKGVLSGEAISFYPNGKVRIIYNFKNNLKIGKTIVVTKNGDGDVFYYEGVSKNGIKVTDPAIFLKIKKYNNPNISQEVSLTIDEVEKKIIPTNKTSKEVENVTAKNKTTESEDDTIYNSMGLDKSPSFIGGNDEMNKYINETFRRKEGMISGKIFISFIVEKDGNLSNIKVIKDFGNGSGDELIFVLNTCKNCWNPAEIKGKKVRCSYSLPITINN